MQIIKLIIFALIALFFLKILAGLLLGAAFMAMTAIIIFALVYLGWKVLFR